MSEEEKTERPAENAEVEADTIFGGTPPGGGDKPPRKTHRMAAVWAACGILAVLLVILAVVLLQTPKGSDTAESTAETETIALNQKAGDEVATVEVQSGETFTIERTAPAEGENRATFTIQGYENLPFNNSMLASLPYNMSEMEADELIEEDAKDLDRFGLESPSATLTAHYDNGDTFTLAVGDKNPLDEAQTYCLWDEDVYLVRTSLVSNFAQPPAYFISKTILEMPEEGDMPEIERVTVERKEKDDLVIEYDHANENAENAGINATHIMVEPVRASLSLEKGQPMVEGMFGLTSVEAAVLCPEDKDLAETGLNNPLCEVTTECEGGKTYHLSIGNAYETEDGTQAYYALFEGVDVIYGISESKAPWVSAEPEQLYSQMIFDSYVWDIEELEVTALGEHALFECAGTDAKDFEVEKDGKKVDTERYRTLFEYIVSLYADELYYKTTLPEGDPDASVRIQMQDGSGYTIDFYRESDLQMMVARDGVPTYRIRYAAIETLAENLKIFDDPSKPFTVTWG